MKYLSALAAVVLTLFVAGSPAAADETWPRIPCLSGAIEQAEVSDGDHLTLTGYLDCGVPEGSPGGLWGYAAFLDGFEFGTLDVVNMNTYSYGDRTAFSNRMQVEPLLKLGICVVTDYEVRIACVNVTRKSWTAPMMVYPTGVEDELVAKPVVRRSGSDTNPVCGHC